jgi:hypothetical protein
MSSAKVFVYRNLRLRKFRVRDLESGQESDVDEVWLTNVKFHVSQAGRLKALRDGERNIHAGLIGTRLEQPPQTVRCDVPVGYNPLQGPYFTTSGHQAIHSAKVAHLINGKVYIPPEERWL